MNVTGLQRGGNSRALPQTLGEKRELMVGDPLWLVKRKSTRFAKHEKIVATLHPLRTLSHTWIYPVPLGNFPYISSLLGGFVAE